MVDVKWSPNLSSNLLLSSVCFNISMIPLHVVPRNSERPRLADSNRATGAQVFTVSNLLTSQRKADSS